MSDYTQEVQDSFQRIGEMLKTAREDRGLTLQEISTFTRINHAFLESIEKGDLSSLPALAFVMGFLRNYAKALALEDDSIDLEIDFLRDLNKPEERRSELKPTNPGLLDQEAPGVNYSLWATLSILLIVLVGGAYFFFASSKIESTVQIESAAQAETAESSSSETTGSEGEGDAGTEGNSSTNPPASVTPTTENAPADSPTGPQEGRQRLELTLRGLERTWVRLSVDRAPPMDVVLDPADTLSWDADQEIRITIGKSQGVSMYLNGEEFLLPQEKDRLIPNLVLNRLTLLRLEN